MCSLIGCPRAGHAVGTTGDGGAGPGFELDTVVEAAAAPVVGLADTPVSPVELADELAAPPGIAVVLVTELAATLVLRLSQNWS